jgi:hypothetical protein
MLLRRIISRLRQGNLADVVLELLIVIGGVFIGIQASNWNDNRLEQEQGRQAAERLLADLRRDLDSRSALVSYFEAVFDSAERTASRLNDVAVDDPTSFVIDAYRATEYAHRPPTRAAFDDIVSSGNLGLIPANVRNAGLIKYFRSDDTSLATRTAVLNSPYRARVRRLLSYEIQAAIRARCSDVYNQTGEIVGFAESCDLGLPTETLHNAATVLHSDAELLKDLRLHFSTLFSQIPVFQGEVVNLESSIEALEDAISSRTLGR